VFDESPFLVPDDSVGIMNGTYEGKLDTALLADAKTQPIICVLFFMMTLKQMRLLSPTKLFVTF